MIPPTSPPPIHPHPIFALTSSPPAPEPAVITVVAPPKADDQRYELLFEGHARVALYSYNDILIRKDTPGLALDAIDINGPYAAYLSVDGWTPLGPSPEEPPPRVIVYGASPHYHLLKLATSLPGPPSQHHPDAAVALAELDTSSAEAYRLSEGEALRKVQILRERPAGARDLGAAPHGPVLRGCYYDA